MPLESVYSVLVTLARLLELVSRIRATGGQVLRPGEAAVWLVWDWRTLSSSRLVSVSIGPDGVPKFAQFPSQDW